jgi:hypothetical protein
MKQETKLKEQFKDRLVIWSEANLNVKFNKLNQFQQSRQMITFFVQEILEKLFPGIVPDDEGELESCIVDGSGDGGADLLYRTDDGQVLLGKSLLSKRNTAVKMPPNPRNLSAAPVTFWSAFILQLRASRKHCTRTCWNWPVRSTGKRIHFGFIS